jgi:transposase
MRPPEVFVRPLAHGEAVRLKRLSKRAEHQSTRQRAAILLASNTRMSAPEIARMWMTDESHVRKVIHEFNERGLDSLRPNYRGGRPRRITAEQRKRIVAVAGARPDSQGVPLTRWSLPRFSLWLAGEGIVEISPAHLGRLLGDAGLSFQRTRSWKASPDPDYAAKAERVLALYERAPKGAAVISFDQMGPISLRPTDGSPREPPGDVQPPPRHPLRARRLRRPRRLPPHPAAAAPHRRGEPALHALDPHLLPAQGPAVLGAGQPLRQLDPRHPQLRRRLEHRTGRRAYLHQLPQQDRVPLRPDHRVRRQPRGLMWVPRS